MIVQLIVKLIMELVHLVILPQMLSNFSVAMLVVGDDNVTCISRRHSRFAIVLSRQIALPVFFVLANILNAERVSIMNQQWFALKEIFTQV